MFLLLHGGGERTRRAGRPGTLSFEENFRVAEEVFVVDLGKVPRRPCRMVPEPALHRHYFTTICLTQRKKGYCLLRISQTQYAANKLWKCVSGRRNQNEPGRQQDHHESGSSEKKPILRCMRRSRFNLIRSIRWHSHDAPGMFQKKITPRGLTLY